MQGIKGSRPRFGFVMNSRVCQSVAWLPDSLFLHCNAFNLMAHNVAERMCRKTLRNLGCGFDSGLEKLLLPSRGRT
jgi:hypothetical protein